MSKLITLREYARLHNVSPATVRRKIKAGSVLAELIDGPRGPQYMIAVDDDEPVQADGDQQAMHAQGGEDGHAQSANGVHDNGQLRTHLEQEVVFLRERLEASQESERQLRTLMAQQGATLQAVTQQLAALPARTQEPSAKHLYLSQTVAVVVGYVLSAGVLLLASGWVLHLFDVIDWTTFRAVTAQLFLAIGAVTSAAVFWRITTMTLEARRTKQKPRYDDDPWITAGGIISGICGLLFMWLSPAF